MPLAEPMSMRTDAAASMLHRTMAKIPPESPGDRPYFSRVLEAGTRLVIPPPTKTPAKATPAKPRQATTSGSQGPAAVLRRHPERLVLVPAFRRAATANGLPTTLLEAVDWQESGWRNQVVSSAHAVGVGQVMPDTIRFVNQALAPVVLDPSLAPSNIAIGAWYLGYLLGQSHGNQRTAVASYYQGPTSVQAHGLRSDTRRHQCNEPPAPVRWLTTDLNAPPPGAVRGGRLAV